MKRAGVIGWPVAHSLSPVLHGYWLKQYGLANRCAYDLLPLKPGEFTRRNLEALRDEKGYIGFNVTIPYKQEAFDFADVKKPGALDAGAANLLVFKEGVGLWAENTDGTGLADSLREELGNASLRGKNIVLIGAGGAARGAIWAFQQDGVGKITILNRHRERADQLAEHAKKKLANGTIRAGSLEDWREAAHDAWLVINTTSAGMKGNPPLQIDLAALDNPINICDIVYNPLETPLLKEAKRLGHNAIDGLGMLMHQAAPSFQAFFYEEMNGETPKVTKGLRERLVKELSSRG